MAMKKRMVLVGIALSACVALAGCGGSSAPVDEVRRATAPNFGKPPGIDNCPALLTVNNISINMTPLHCAVYSNSIPAVRYLLERAYNVNVKDTFSGATPLHWAVHLNSIDAAKYLDMARYLLKVGANVNAKDKDGKTPLHWGVVVSGRPVDELIEVVELLLKWRADVNAKDNDGRTPLWFLVDRVNPDYGISAARYLLKQGADVNAKDKKGHTSLHRSVLAGGGIILKSNFPMAKFLLEQGANANAEALIFDIRSTLLHQAAKFNNADLAVLLLTHGADVNAKDGDGNTPLYFAAREQAFDIAGLLLENGADPRAENTNRVMPICDMSHSHQEMNELFHAYGAGELAICGRASEYVEKMSALNLSMRWKEFFQSLSNCKNIVFCRENLTVPGMSPSEYALWQSALVSSGYRLKICCLDEHPVQIFDKLPP